MSVGLTARGHEKSFQMMKVKYFDCSGDYMSIYICENSLFCKLKNETFLGFPGGAAVENLPANAGDTGSSPGLGRSHMPRSN